MRLKTKLVLAITLLVFLIAGLLSFAIARQITRPVMQLVDATKRAADGDYSADITVNAGGGTATTEFNGISTISRSSGATSFNNMTIDPGATVHLTSGQTFAVTGTFTAAGTYPYFCRPHAGAGMVGSVVVQ